MSTSTAQEIFALAVERRRGGLLAEAETLCRQILAEQPRHADALALLALLAHQTGRNELAVELLGQAIAVNAASAALHFSLGNALRGLGRFEEAVAAFRRALALEPGLIQAYNNLGNSLRDLGRAEEAIDAYRTATKLKPDHAKAHSNLGTVLNEAGRVEEAVNSLTTAIGLNPELPEAHFNLGAALAKSGRQIEAEKSLGRAIALRPGYTKAQLDLAQLQLQMGRLDAAASTARIVLEHAPDSSKALCLLGSILAEQNQPEAAIACFQRALALNPNFAEAHGNLGAALKASGQLDDAIASGRKAISLNAGVAELQANLGSALKDMGQIEEAVQACRRAVLLKPEDAALHSCLAGTLHYHHGYDSRAIAEECRNWNQRHAIPLAKFINPHLNDPNPNRRLKVGYVSPDFHSHVVAQNLLAWLGHHDRSQFEIICYAQVRAPDAITAEFQRLADGWRNILGLSDQQVAEQIREDGIDILVDLALHTADNRLLVFARKPAPVQITCTGYPGTTGLTAIDCRLSDPYLDPVDADESVYSEKTVRLANTFWCYDPRENADLEVNSLPCLDGQDFTFGCLNNFCKINPPMLAIWAEVLKQIKYSRLLLLAPVGSHRAATAQKLGDLGVDPARISFLDHRPRREYLRAYHQIDLGLDTLPYNGHTTSLDALWMGVPVVTLVGSTVVGRAGWSQLSNLGLTELAGRDSKQFVKIAVELALDRPRLAQLRSSLRQRMARSPLMDTKRYARDVELVYRGLWREWTS